MDEVENPALPAAGESSPTIAAVDDENAAATTKTTDVASNTTALPPLPAAPPKPARPGLKRDGSAQPPQQPPPAPPAQVIEEQSQSNPDSLTLADLKRIRDTFPNTNQPTVEKEILQDYGKVYDFEYKDAQSFPAELEEWFSYSEREYQRLDGCKTAFNNQWRDVEKNGDWLDATDAARRAFVKRYLDNLKAKTDVAETLQILTYIALGVWEETAGQTQGCDVQDLFSDKLTGGSRVGEYSASSLHIQWIVSMNDTLHSCGALQPVYETLRRVCDDDFASAPTDGSVRNDAQPKRVDESMELWCCLTLMYIFIELARTTKTTIGQQLRTDITSLQPNFLNYLTLIVAKLRWDDTAPIPLTKMLLLSWKAILVFFGGIEEVDKIKASLRQDAEEKDDRGEPIITASPLDYHLFRQEISSKYPAYQPPQPLFALEPENNSILPPLKHRRPSAAPSETSLSSIPIIGTESLMHQPIHIATPAPSPPPSPAVPGKAGKKQNYQTNQMFPFLYPPLESTSNNLGGKGSTELQDLLVGRRWEGSDIPSSILEAAELFAARMRATRAMKQLWTARVDFMKYERGWKDTTSGQISEDDGFEILPEPAIEETAEQGQPLARTEAEKKLAAVDAYYKDSLPYLQSVVIVLLKAVLHNVTDLVTKGSGQNGLQAGIQFMNDANGFANGSRPAENGIDDVDESVSEELNRLRSQEISSKALSAIILLLLKWFKVNHILQYEYLTQLLLDSNYVPLILKLWQTQEIGRSCHMSLDHKEESFFYHCRATSRQGVTSSTNESAIDDGSEDEAAPPPIRLKRDSQAPQPPSTSFMHPPELDELGYPLTALPSAPIQSFSYRNIFSSINYLRILQKITRRKTHRALLLVSYKSSNHLKKSLKIPIFQLRYYTLKLFKSQVPFCGRKWRQGNMKIITAVWLSVPAELRDDWLTGGGGGMGGSCIGDVDGTVDDALPLEQSLRALTHWWNVRNYPEVMGVDDGLLEEEVDFFQREIEKIELGRALAAGEEGELMDEITQQDAEQWQGPIDGY